MDLNRDDWAPASALGGAFGALADIVLHSGETMIAFTIFFVETIDLWLPFLSRTAEVAQNIEWLPYQPLQTAVTIAMIVFVLVYGVRLLNRWRRMRSTNEN